MSFSEYTDSADDSTSAIDDMPLDMSDEGADGYYYVEESNNAKDSLLVVLTLDGTLHVVYRDTGRIRWSTRIDPMLSTSHTPLRSKDEYHHSRHAATTGGNVIPVVALGNARTANSPAGALLYYDTAEHALFDAGMHVQSLVMHSPIHFPATKQILLGRRTARIIRLRLYDGNSVIDSSHSYHPHARLANPMIIIGRTDYELRAVDEQEHAVEWSMAYSELDGIHSSIDATTQRDLDVAVEEDTVSVKGRWSVRFASVPVQLFTLRPHMSGGEHGSDWTLQPIAFNKGNPSNEGIQLAAVQTRHAPFYVLPGSLYYHHRHHLGAAGETSLLPVQTASLPVELDYWQPWLTVMKYGHPDRPAISYAGHSSSVPLLAGPEARADRRNGGALFGGTVVVTVLTLLYVMFKSIERVRHRRHCRSLKSQQLVPVELLDADWVSREALVRSSISVDRSALLGHGSGGSVVYAGRFGDRPAAVKRIPSTDNRVVDREVVELQRVDRHEHVRRLYGYTSMGGYTYVALELADCSLSDYFSVYGADSRVHPIALCKQMVEGVRHLHSQSLVHRDIKPANALMVGHRLAISDLGLARNLDRIGDGGGGGGGDGAVTTVVTTGGGGGTPGWRAPECILVGTCKEARENGSIGAKQGDGRDKKEVDRIDWMASDIHSLACLLYYTCSEGQQHLFGDPVDRERNAIAGAPQWHRLERLSAEDNNLLIDLVTWMTALKPSERPSIHVVAEHPLFWSTSKRLSFILDLSDWMEKQDRFSSLPGILEFRCVRHQAALSSALLSESISENNTDWLDVIPAGFWSDLTRYRKYSGRSLVDLLRAIRNKRHHYHELPPSIKELIGGEDDAAYWRFFGDAFPRILVRVWRAAREWGLFEREARFGKYGLPSPSSSS